MRASASESHFGRITKEGDPEMRRLLVQAAHGCFGPGQIPTSGLGSCTRGAKRQGKAVVALARKLAVLMHHLWVTGEVYQAFPNKEVAQAA